MQQQLLIGGIGGQGVVVSTKLLGAVATKMGLFGLHYAAYSGEVRGGWVECALTISDKPVQVSPVVTAADSCIVMHKESYDRLIHRVRSDGLLIVNSSLIERDDYPASMKLIKVPATEMGEKIGHEIAATMCILGAYVQLTGLVPLADVKELLAQLIPPYRHRLLEIDRNALDAGAEFAASHHWEAAPA